MSVISNVSVPPHGMNPDLATCISILAEQEYELSQTSTGPICRSELETSGSSDLHRIYSQLVGQTVDRFEVLQLLGVGGMAAVYHVRDTRRDPMQTSSGRFRSHDDEYAAKIFVPQLHLSTAGSTKYTPANKYGGARAQRFIREYRMGQRILSKAGRVIRAYHFGTAEVFLPTDTVAALSPTSIYYFTMDLVRGGSLPRISEPHPAEMVVALGLGLLSALDDLHSRNVVHRDLTCANILLTERWDLLRENVLRPGNTDLLEFPRVVLADLGIAKHGSLRHDTAFGQVLGTRAFLPPESFVLGNYDPRADLYAAGVILYWLATGKHPIEAAGCSTTDALCGAPYELKPIHEFVQDFPADVASMIMSLLSRDPTQRPRTAALAYDVFASWWGSISPRCRIPERKSLEGKPYLCQPRFIGRLQELSRARSFLAATLQYIVPDQLRKDDLPSDYKTVASSMLPASVLTIGGPAGIGKSRLLAEIAQLATDMTAIVLQGQCVSSGSLALQSLSPMLEGIERLDEASRVELSFSKSKSSAGHRTSTILGEGYTNRCARLEHTPSEEEPEYVLLKHAPTTPEDERTQASLRRRFLMAQAAARLLYVARSQPLLIIQEDSHWSDESSTAMLEYLLQSVAIARSMGHPARIAFILTHRPQSSDNAVERIVSILDRQAEVETPAVRLELEDMTNGEVSELCSSLLQTPVNSKLSHFAEVLFDGEDTRPLYVEQTLRTMLEDGLLTQDTFTFRSDGTKGWSGNWNLDATIASSAFRPTSIHEAIGRNVEQLSSGTAKALMFGAADGRVFDLEIVSRAAGFDSVECLDFLDEAISAGFISDVDALDLAGSVSMTVGRRFRFLHDRFREAIYHAADRETRVQCHARLADAIIDLRGDTSVAAEVLARHFEESEQFDRAYAHHITAAKHAMTKHVYDHAVKFYRQAFVSADKAGIEPPTELRTAIVNASVSAGFYDDAAQQLMLLLQDSRLSPQERLAANLQLAELKHRQQDYRNAVQPLKQILHDIGDHYPKRSWRRRLVTAWRMTSVIACGLWPRLVNMRPARDQPLAEARIRAWYSLAECLYFVDYRDFFFMLASSGKLVVSLGLNPFSPAMFAGTGFFLAGGGKHGLARAYMKLARRSITVAEAGSRGLRAPDATVRARLNMHNTCKLVLGGELGEAYRAEHETCAREGLKAGRECGDPQRLWMSICLTATAHRLMGHFRSYQLLMAHAVESATASRLFYIARLHELRRRAVEALATRAYANAYNLGESCARIAERAGGYTEMVACRALACWAQALDAGGSQTNGDLVRVAVDTVRTYLDRNLFDIAYWPLSQCLATLALCQRQGADPSPIRHLQRACRTKCLRDRKETPLYLGACGALDVVDGKLKSGAKLFRTAIETACRQGTIAQLLEVYRLAAAVYPPESPERDMYAWLDEQLTRAVITAPSPNLEQLFEGHLGPTIKPPRPFDWLTLQGEKARVRL